MKTPKLPAETLRQLVQFLTSKFPDRLFSPEDLAASMKFVVEYDGPRPFGWKPHVVSHFLAGEALRKVEKVKSTAKTPMARMAALKAWETRRANDKKRKASDRALKAWETRRANQENSQRS